MKLSVWLLLGSFAGLFAISLLGPPYVLLTLALAATALAVILLLRRPSSLTWRLATVGAVAWAIEECAWAVNRLAGSFEPTLLTEVAYYVGAAAWLAALILAPVKRLPRTLVVVVVPLVGFIAWLLVESGQETLAYFFPLTEFALLLAAIPFLGGLMRGGASEGRLLVALGFYLRALGAAAYTWLAGGSDSAYLMLWLLGYIVLAVGVYMEVTDVHVDLVSAGVAILCLQVVGARILALMYARPELRDGLEAVLLMGSLAFLQFAVVMVILLNNNRRQTDAQEELRSWATLLERVMADPGEGMTLAGLMDRTLKRVPSLHGIEVHEDGAKGNLSGYAYPLVTGGTEVGRLFFPRQPDSTGVLDTSAPLLAARVQQLLEHNRWRDAALTDPLTDLLNRRGFELRAPDLIARAQKQERPVSVAMIDIDHFKRVNDVYGHSTGDEALKALADLLVRHIRPHDLTVRWGGEEFLVVLNTSRAGAVDAMTRLRRELSGVTPRQIAWPLAASVGVAGGSVPPDSGLTRWIEAADAALLEAKRLGRNRIEVAPE